MGEQQQPQAKISIDATMLGDVENERAFFGLFTVLHREYNIKPSVDNIYIFEIKGDAHLCLTIANEDKMPPPGSYRPSQLQLEEWVKELSRG